MSLNIKNAEAHGLATELASITGETLTEAVTVALRERLARERADRESDLLAEELLAIGRRCAAHLHSVEDGGDHTAFLYDERGLPA